MTQYDKNGLTEQEFLASYNPGNYPRPSVAADITIFTIGDSERDNYRRLAKKELQILLIKRGGHPYLGCWALPGGFVRPDETVGEAAKRELYEETGVNRGYLEQLYTFSEPGRDPRTWVMSCTHMALIDSQELRLKAGDDASDARWFRLTCTSPDNGDEDTVVQCKGAKRYRLELAGDGQVLSAEVEQSAGAGPGEFQIIENNGLAFDHAKIIACAVLRLRNKVEHTDLALNLMPSRFTLTELQQVCEVILDKPLLKAAFRRKVKCSLTATGEYTEHGGHRPSQLYCRNEGRNIT